MSRLDSYFKWKIEYYPKFRYRNWYRASVLFYRALRRKEK